MLIFSGGPSPQQMIAEVLRYYSDPEIYNDAREDVGWPDYEWPEFPVIEDSGQLAKVALENKDIRQYLGLED